MRESTVEAYFVARVKASGGEQRKLQWIGRRHGPDRFVKYLGVPVVLVELKRPGKTPREGQEREIARLRAVGCDVRVIDTKQGVDNFIRDMTEWRQYDPRTL
ncbi:VRR-NUC domain-containing protein [Paraburkholderia sp. Ac-20347]|uniref:VRR-NUC domain-containing protein n=1 Tax=Paraburkholderia sp. Ac-20347 TaxID=2703892 RepID=UPI0019807086|nr:VRR-NUC domain-containing protein [Paraburkholderia sp. Ac-20347]MBN3809442.1 VRR-NUC domain-containing protein [Paraburkholderia sp. Ac-20347]